jgi:hypothetical protein
MKYLKLFEGWSDQYLHDFTDEEKFTIEEDGMKVKGKYKGAFDTSDMTNLFADAVSKMSSDYRILKAQSFFNQVTGNAKFEIEVHNFEDELEFIEIDVSGQKVKWIPMELTNIYISKYNTDEPFQILRQFTISGRLENGSKKNLEVWFEPTKIKKLPNWDGRHGFGIEGKKPTKKEEFKITYRFGQRTNSVSITPENWTKLVKLLTENKINLGIYANVYQNYINIMIETLTLLSN